MQGMIRNARTVFLLFACLLALRILPLAGIALLIGMQESCTRGCTKTLAQAPEVEQFRLGSPLVDLQLRFPGLSVEQRPFGESQVKITIMPGPMEARNGLGWAVISASRYPELADTRRIIIKLVDEQLAEVRIYYGNEQQLDLDQFLTRAKSKVGIFEGWRRQQGLEDAQVFCDRFFVEAGIDRGENLNEEKLPYIEIGNLELLSKATHRDPDLYPGGSPRKR